VSLPLWILAGVLAAVVLAVVFWHYLVVGAVMFAAYRVVTR
jgi:hypothetical protein